MGYNERIKRCYYALFACIMNPKLSVDRGLIHLGVKEHKDKEKMTAEEKAERDREKAKAYYYAHKEQVKARQKAYRERMRGNKDEKRKD